MSRGRGERAWRRQLRLLARRHGVELAYTDTRQRRCVARDEPLVAVLRALGVALRGPEDAPRALARLEAAEAARLLPPVVLAWNGRLGAVDGGAAPRGDTDRVRWTLRLEDGGRREGECGWRAVRRERGAPRGRLALALEVPLGYHQLTVAAGRERARALVIAAPRQAWVPPGWAPALGVFAPLYALHSRASWGIGDFGDLARLAAWARAEDAAVVATLPLTAAFPAEPGPYRPVSRLFWNELFVDVEALPEVAATPAGRRLAASAAFRDELRALRRGGQVDYEGVARLKRRVLEACAAALPPEGPRRAAFEAHRAADPRLEEYARFRAFAERQGMPWRGWPAAARAGRLRPQDVDAGAVRYHTYVQWVAAEQIAALAGPQRAALYLDLPLGVHPDGYDTWSERASFALDAEMGAPPDDFFQGGQAWGVPPLHPARLRESGYAYLAACLRHHMRAAGLLRLDHVMAFHRVFWVPRGATAREGVYVRHHREELLAVLLLEAHRARCIPVGENLGTVPPAVDAALARHRIWGMSVLQLTPPDAVGARLGAGAARSVASLNTHDLLPFAAFWRQAPPHTRAALLRVLRRRAGLRARRPELRAVLAATLRLLATSAAPLVVVGLEDLWAEERPQNRPGTAEAENWRQRLRLSLDALAAPRGAAARRLLAAARRPLARGRTRRQESGDAP